MEIFYFWPCTGWSLRGPTIWRARCFGQLVGIHRQLVGGLLNQGSKGQVWRNPAERRITQKVINRQQIYNLSPLKDFFKSKAGHCMLARLFAYIAGSSFFKYEYERYSV